MDNEAPVVRHLTTLMCDQHVPPPFSPSPRVVQEIQVAVPESSSPTRPTQSTPSSETFFGIHLRGGSSSNENKGWKRKLSDNKRVPSAMWVAAGGSGKAPTAGHMKAGRKVAEAKEEKRAKARADVRAANAERPAARRDSGPETGGWLWWMRRTKKKRRAGGAAGEANAASGSGGAAEATG